MVFLRVSNKIIAKLTDYITTHFEHRHYKI